MVKYRVIYGFETETIEDPDQIVLLDLPDQCSEMDTEDLETWIVDYWADLKKQSILGLNDVIETILSVDMPGPAVAELLEKITALGSIQ